MQKFKVLDLNFFLNECEEELSELTDKIMYESDTEKELKSIRA